LARSFRLANGLFTNFKWGYDGQPQDMLVEHGRVIWRRPSSGNAEGGLDYKGQWLLPSFIDNHCHILPTGLDLQKLHLGSCQDRASVLDAVRDANSTLAPGKWLHAVHYDQNRFPDGRHLTLAELDAISSDRPILLRHVNGHASVANSAALRVAKVSEDTPNPEGGAFGRDESGRLSGLLLENAHEFVTNSAPRPTLGEMVDAIMAAGQKMSELGIGTASDMMTGRFDLADELEAYRIAGERGCAIRTRLYVQWATVFGPRGMSAAEFELAQASFNPNLTRVAGIKIFADGAIGSATAAIYGSYSGQPIDRRMVLSRRGRSAAAAAPEDVQVSGQLIYSPDKLKEMVRIADEAGYPVAIHTIGDYATDLVMDAYEQVLDPSKHRIEHAMILSDAQIERMARLGCFCTFQPEFLMRFGVSYLRQLGPERASKLKRGRSVLDAGIPLSLSSDRPIVAGDPWDGIRTAVNRPKAFDPSENMTLEEALNGYTRWGAEANEDKGLLGALEPGEIADVQLLSESPTQHCGLTS
jgi:predicted amidohydrolase YtcJ